MLSLQVAQGPYKWHCYDSFCWPLAFPSDVSIGNCNRKACISMTGDWLGISHLDMKAVVGTECSWTACVNSTQMSRSARHHHSCLQVLKVPTTQDKYGLTKFEVIFLRLLLHFPSPVLMPSCSFFHLHIFLHLFLLLYTSKAFFMPVLFLSFPPF